MPRNVAACRSAVVVFCIAIILSCDGVARAQGVDTFNPGASQQVVGLAVQPDGKIVVGGWFTALGGVATTPRNRIGRLNVDGTVDPSFNPGANGPVHVVAVQADGKILAGGNFTSVGGGTGLTSARSYIARFNADGAVDLTFNPGANLPVHAMAVQPDGKILVAGAFSMLGGVSRIALGRLNADGSIDAFNPGVTKTFGAPIVYTMALQPDGQVVVGGYFNGLGTTTRNFIGRVSAAGTVDAGFNPGASSIGGVNALALQADGKIIVGGSFTGLGLGTGATLRKNIGRLYPDGTVDIAFNPGTESQVLTLGVQADGKILAGGYFKWLGGDGGPFRSDRNYIGRLTIDGAVDTTFNPGAGNVVNAIALQPDGAIVVGGLFGTLGGGTGAQTVRYYIGRLTNPDPATQTLTLTNGGTVETWLRSGGGPEVSHVTFEFSFDGTFYSLLGYGGRIAGGWQLTSVNLPSARRVYVRARGFYGSGYQNGSGSIAESILIRDPLSSSDGDFDGDGKADLTAYRPSTGVWYVLRSGTNYSAHTAYQWGVSTDIPVPGDYDGDGLADIAIYRPASGSWFVLLSSTSFSSFISYQWGVSTDIPVPRDYDGDGKTDIAVYRPSSGSWWVLRSSDSSVISYQFGISTDLPMPRDYDGDGKADIAVYRPANGNWFVLLSTTNGASFISYQFGLSTDTPVPADYDGDGKTDIAVYRPATGVWYVLSSVTNNATLISYQWGLSTDVPVPADYDGDRKTDIAIYRPSTGAWFVLRSGTANSSISYQWGASGDVPVLKRP